MITIDRRLIGAILAGSLFASLIGLVYVRGFFDGQNTIQPPISEEEEDDLFLKPIFYSDKEWDGEIPPQDAKIAAITSQKIVYGLFLGIFTYNLTSLISMYLLVASGVLFSNDSSILYFETYRERPFETTNDGWALYHTVYFPVAVTGLISMIIANLSGVPILINIELFEK